MKSNWEQYGFTDKELMALEAFNAESDDDTLGLYIEAERRRFHDEFYRYLMVNGCDPFSF